MYSPGDFESTFIEVIFPNKKNMIIGCARHPTSNSSIHDYRMYVIDTPQVTSPSMIIGCIYRHPSSNISIHDYRLDVIDTPQVTSPSMIIDCMLSTPLK